MALHITIPTFIHIMPILIMYIGPVCVGMCRIILQDSFVRYNVTLVGQDHIAGFIRQV